MSTRKFTVDQSTLEAYGLPNIECYAIKDESVAFPKVNVVFDAEIAGLFAASPDLLQVAKQCRLVLSSSNPETWERWRNVLRCNLEAAITKAETPAQ